MSAPGHHGTKRMKHAECMHLESSENVAPSRQRRTTRVWKRIKSAFSSNLSASLLFTIALGLGVIVVGVVAIIPIYIIESTATYQAIVLLEKSLCRTISHLIAQELHLSPSVAKAVGTQYVQDAWNAAPTGWPDSPHKLLGQIGAAMDSLYPAYVDGTVYRNRNYAMRITRRGSDMFGGYTENTTVMPQYVMNRSTFDLVHPLTVYKADGVSTTFLGSRKCIAYGTVVKPWQSNMKIGRPSPQRWSPDSVAEVGQYFCLVLPFRDNQDVGFQRMALNTSTVFYFTSQLMPLLRRSGRVLVYDPLRNTVVYNSWGDSAVVSEGSPGNERYQSLPLSNITDPLMKYILATQLTRVKRTVADSAYVFSPRSQSTPLGEALVQRTLLVDETGTYLNILITILSMEFQEYINTLTTILPIVLAVSVFLFTTTLIWGIFMIIRPLRQLVPALQLASTLSIDPTDKRNNIHSLIKEISMIHEVYVRLLEHLLLLRSFVPEAVLACMEFEQGVSPSGIARPLSQDGPISTIPFANILINGGTSPRPSKSHQSGGIPSEMYFRSISTNPSNITTQPHIGHNTSRTTTSSINTGTLTSHSYRTKPQREERTGDDTEMEYVASSCGLSVSASPGALQSIREGPQLSYATTHVTPCTNPSSESDCGIFHERLNSFTSTYCTVMTIDSVWEPSQPATALTEFFEAIVACVAEHNGCIEALRPDRTVVSFGAHAPLPMHASKACACALAIYARLSQHKRDGVVMTIDSSEFLVGTCGAHARNARVLFGILHFHAVSRVLRRISCHVGAMMGTATHLQELQLYPIDCVQVPQSVVPTVVYELRTTPSGDREARQRARLTYNHFRHGLSAMRQGNYTLARSHFRQLDPSDGQAARLLAICERCIDTDSAQPYVVRIGETYEVRTTGSTPAAGACTSLATLSMTAPTEHNTIMRRSSSVGTGEFHSGLQHRVTAATDQAEHEASVGAGASRREGGAAEEGTVVGLPASAPQPPETLFDPEYSPLFELMAPSESSDSVSVHDGDDSGVPLVLTDNNGKRWSRSLRNFSEGAFSVVYLGMSESGEQVALKCIPRRRRDISQASLAAELEMASRLRHANIVRYVSYCETPGHLTLVMEYVPGGSLAGVIGSFGRLTATAARRFVTDVLRGLHYLHSRGIVHCDVKPHNVLLGMDGVCKLSDFGSTVSEAADAARVGTDDVVLRGTALYMAPEVARGERCTSQSDIYSLGVSLLEMLTGQPPWGWTAAAVAAAAAGSEDVGGSAEQLHLLMRRDVMFARALGRGEVAPVVPDTLSPDVAGFVRACCQEDPARRPTALQLQSFPFVL